MGWKGFAIIGLSLLAALQADIIQHGDCYVEVTDMGGHHYFIEKGQYVDAKLYHF